MNGKGCSVEHKRKPWTYKGKVYWKDVVILTYEDGKKEEMPWKKFKEKAFTRHQEQPNAEELLAKMLK